MKRPTAKPGAARAPWALPTAALALAAAFALAQAPVDTSTLPKGIGPVEHVALADIDEQLAGEGKTVFDMLCASCHRFGERYVGPDLAGVTQRRAPEWIMNMILNPEEMVFNDDTAYQLLAEYMTQMPRLPVTQDQARAVLEYFRLTDAASAD